MYRAALDTSVLVPSLTRDFLLQLATERCYQAIWGRAVVVELDYVLERLDEKSGRRTAEESRAYRARLLDRMEAAFPGSCMEAATKGDSPTMAWSIPTTIIWYTPRSWVRQTRS